MLLYFSTQIKDNKIKDCLGSYLSRHSTPDAAGISISSIFLLSLEGIAVLIRANGLPTSSRSKTRKEAIKERFTPIRNIRRVTVGKALNPFCNFTHREGFTPRPSRSGLPRKRDPQNNICRRILVPSGFIDKESWKEIRKIGSNKFAIQLFF